VVPTGRTGAVDPPIEAVHDVPPGSVVVVRSADGMTIDGDDIVQRVAAICGHTRFVVIILPDTAELSVVDAERFLADLHTELRVALAP
jgi:hypothetical protein